MFRITPLVLAASLFGIADADCYARYGAGPYYEGDKVSESVTVEVSCNPDNDAACGSDGKKDETKTYNWECINEAWCSNSGFAPGGIYSSTAWSQGAECDPTDPTVTVAPPNPWNSDGGCPEAYSSGSDYESGDAVSVDRGTWTEVFTCVDGANSAYCSNGGFAPRTSIHWEGVWEEQGSCTGTITPTKSPVNVALAFQGGCPEEYAAGTEYEEGDRVSVENLVFQCRPFPASGHCGQAGFAPLYDGGVEDAWKTAWTVLGSCDGTIDPTQSPVFVDLVDQGRCPSEWEARSGDDAYEAGDRVSLGKLVLACNPWPMEAHCSQSGYAPGGDTDYWKEVWTVVGSCDDTAPPTSSPVIDQLAADWTRNCPPLWVGGANLYEEGDEVSALVSEDPPRRVTYRCKAWPFAGYCGQHSPVSSNGDMGWTVVGTCGEGRGTYYPTQSPVWSDDALEDECPGYYAEGVEYEGGDQVSVLIQDAADDSEDIKLVYECKPWPNSGYCSQAGYNPVDSEFAHMAWTFKYPCQGTKSPTDAPTLYSDLASGATCTYDKCVTEEETVTCTVGASPPRGAFDISGQITGSIVSITPNQGSCTCPAGTTSNCSVQKTITTCTETAVAPYNSGTTYEFDDVIRIGGDRYKCRGWPNGLWCNNEAYSPTDPDGIWRDAWTTDGACPRS
jgi:hypothetical protein